MKSSLLALARRHDACRDALKWLSKQPANATLETLAESKPEWAVWLAVRPGVLTDRELRLFAVWCARQALALVPNPDPRSVAACDVAERFANGQATERELNAARAAAWCAAAAAAAAAYAAAATAAYAADAADATAAYAADAADAWSSSSARLAQARWLVANTKPNFSTT